jgi:hypothetical protein
MSIDARRFLYVALDGPDYKLYEQKGDLNDVTQDALENHVHAERDFGADGDNIVLSDGTTGAVTAPQSIKLDPQTVPIRQSDGTLLGASPEVLLEEILDTTYGLTPGTPSSADILAQHYQTEGAIGVDERGEPYFYDKQRGEWLSYATFEFNFASVSSIIADYFYIPQGQQCSATYGYYCESDMTLVAARASSASVTGAGFGIKIYVGGFEVSSALAFPISAQGTGTKLLDVNVNSGDQVSAFTPGTAPAGVNITFVMRRRL